jgi:[ribosomal protein S5]-alanine N-acetyltransferase
MKKKSGKPNPNAPIRTERLILRSLSKPDEDLFIRLFTSEKVMRYVRPPLEREQACSNFKKALELTHRSRFTRRVVTLVERATKKTIGISSIHMVDTKAGCALVGTLLSSEAHSKRYGMECSVALIAKAFTRPRVKMLMAHVAVGHTATERLVEDLGFTRSGKLDSDGVYPERSVWTLGRPEWRDHVKAAAK